LTCAPEGAIIYNKTSVIIGVSVSMIIKKMYHENRIEPMPGVALIAAGSLRDPNFIRTVILLCEHTDEGSFGLVLNQTLPLKLSDGFKNLRDWDAPLFKGGPVQAGALHFLHGNQNLEIGSREILPGVYWGGDFHALNDLMASSSARPSQFRFFAGYSGWGSGQLQAEIDRQDWYLARMHSGLVFCDDADDHWRQILRSMGSEYAMISNLPVNAQLN